MVAPFLLVIKDEDAKVFSVRGPMMDDSSWVRRVVAAQKTGRSVRCFTPASRNPADVAAAMRADFGYAEVEDVPLPV